MDLRRLRAGEWITGVAGVVLFVSLFQPWYDLAGIIELNAFETFKVYDLLLAALAASGVAVFVVTATQRSPAMGIALDGLVSLFALVMSVALLIRVLNLPASIEDPTTDRLLFAWVGLAATFAILVGGFVSMRDERLSKPGKWTDPTGVPVDKPPEIETISSP